MDLERIKEEAKSPTHEFTPRLFHKIESISALESEIESALKAEYMAFDIETCNNQISCIGFATSESYAFVVPIHMHETSFWSVTDEKIIWRLIEKLLGSNVKKIGQNANFDMFFLKSTLGITVNNIWLDTMNAFHCIYPELPKGLDTICSIYTDQPYYKDMIKTEYYKYNALDNMITYESALKIKEELKEFRTWGFYRNVTHPMLGILLDMEAGGVRIDEDKKELASLAISAETKELQEKWDKALGYNLNVNSPKKVCDFLYTDIGLPPQYNRKTGRVTSNVKALHRLSIKHPSIIFDFIEILRKRRKLLSTYLNANMDADGRMRCSYVLYGTETGRLASKMSRFGTGMQMQNVPKGICREIVIPDEGCMFISADLSQAEMRVVAWLANDTVLIDTFNSGKDVFNKVASIVFDISVDKVSPEQRQLAKHISHACNYGMGPTTLSEISGLSYADSKEKLNLYHINFPRIRMWQMEIEARLRKVRMLETPMGRKRTFFGSKEL
jgi:DNA polymerase-1